MEEKLNQLKNSLGNILNFDLSLLKKCIVVLDGKFGDVTYEIDFNKNNKKQENDNSILLEKNKYEEMKNEIKELKKIINNSDIIYKQSFNDLEKNNKELEKNIKEINKIILENKNKDNNNTIQNIHSHQYEPTNKQINEIPNNNQILDIPNPQITNIKSLNENKNEINIQKENKKERFESKFINKKIEEPIKKITNIYENNKELKEENLQEKKKETNIQYQNLDNNINNNPIKENPKFNDYDKIVKEHSKISFPREEKVKKRFTSVDRTLEVGIKLKEGDIDKMSERIMKKYKLENYYNLNDIKKKIIDLNTKSVLDKTDLMEIVGKYLYDNIKK